MGCELKPRCTICGAVATATQEHPEGTRTLYCARHMPPSTLDRAALPLGDRPWILDEPEPVQRLN
jgi:hypothetical protein